MWKYKTNDKFDMQESVKVPILAHEWDPVYVSLCNFLPHVASLKYESMQTYVWHVHASEDDKNLGINSPTWHPRTIINHYYDINLNDSW